MLFGPLTELAAVGAAAQRASRKAQGTAHLGILEAAKDLVADLAAEGVLAALLEGRPLPPNAAHRASADCRCAARCAGGYKCNCGLHGVNVGTC